MFKFGKKKGDPNADAPADKSVDADAAEGEEGAPKKKKLPMLFIIAPVACWSWAAAARRPSS